MVNFHLLNDHEHISDHRPLTLNINFAMHKSSIEDNSNSQMHFLFHKNKDDIFLKYLNSESNALSYKNNSEYLYHNFTTTLSNSIKKLCIEVLCKKKNRINHPCYDNMCKFARNCIKDSSNESLKYNKINRYKVVIKRKNKHYIDRKKQRLLHLSKLDHYKLWRKIPPYKTKENNMILLRDYNSYLKIFYESPIVTNDIPNISKEFFFSIEDKVRG